MEGAAVQADTATARRIAVGFIAEGCNTGAPSARYDRSRREQHMFRPGDRIRSFGYAFQGLGFMLKTQQNAWIHLVATAAVIGAGVWVKLSFYDWRWIVSAIGFVWVAEIVNTAFEHLCDVVQPEFHVSVKVAKDVAAGAVLVAAFIAVVIALLVFLPYFGLPL
jgi:diacylglycerol kinase (ATP)